MTQFQQLLLLISSTAFVIYVFVELAIRTENKRRDKEERDKKIMYLLGKDFNND